MNYTATYVEISLSTAKLKQEGMERINAHIAEMSSRGWRIVSTLQSYPTAPLVIFWQCD